MSRTAEDGKKAGPVRYGRAFGLELSVGFPLPGLPPLLPRPGCSPVRLIRAQRRELINDWPPDRDLLTDRRRPDGAALFRLEFHPALGHRMTAAGWGCYVVAPPGLLVRCAPVRAAAWRWQRFLVGQVLPFVSLIHGFEGFHASAVTAGDKTVAFTGRSGAGKSTIATSMVLRGWRLVTDDVLTVDIAGDGGVRVHPGMDLMSIRHGPAKAFGRALERLGPVIGTDEEAVRVVVPTAKGPRRLSSLYIVEPAEGGQPRIEPMRPVDPRLLLAATFNLVVRSPDRLTRQLDICSLISRAVAVYRLVIPSRARPSLLAELVTEHALGPAGVSRGSS